MSEEYEKIADHTQIGQRRISTRHLPDGVVLRGLLRLVASVYVDGQVVHRAGRRTSTPSAPSRSGMSCASTNSGLKTGYTRMCRSDSAMWTTMDRAGPR